MPEAKAPANLREIRALIADDAHALTFQSFGQYRTALLKSVDATLSTNAGEAAPVATVVSKHGDPEAFGEREIKVLADLQKLPYGTKLYAHPPAAVHGQSASTDAPAGWLELQDDPRVNEIVSGLYRRFKDWSQRGFSAEDVTWCEVKADVIRLIAATPPAAIPAAPSEAFTAAYMAACKGRAPDHNEIGLHYFRAGATLAQPAPVQQEAATSRRRMSAPTREWLQRHLDKAEAEVPTAGNPFPALSPEHRLFGALCGNDPSLNKDDVRAVLTALQGMREAWAEQFGENACDCRPEPENAGHMCAYCQAGAALQPTQGAKGA